MLLEFSNEGMIECLRLVSSKILNLGGCCFASNLFNKELIRTSRSLGRNLVYPVLIVRTVDRHLTQEYDIADNVHKIIIRTPKGANQSTNYEMLSKYFVLSFNCLRHISRQRNLVIRYFPSRDMENPTREPVSFIEQIEFTYLAAFFCLSS